METVLEEEEDWEERWRCGNGAGVSGIGDFLGDVIVREVARRMNRCIVVRVPLLPFGEVV